MDPELNDDVDMVLLQGPPEARSPMERRILRNPAVRTPSGEFKLIPYTSVQPAQQGMARPNQQAEALAGAIRARGAAGGVRGAEICLVVERSPAD
eukprot:13146722-Alexandrium_andersonii.AAC.1